LFVFSATAPSGPGSPHSPDFMITHNDALQLVGLLWTSDQLVAETSTRQHTTLTTDIHALGGILTHSPSKRAIADLRLRPRGHWDRLLSNTGSLNYKSAIGSHIDPLTGSPPRCLSKRVPVLCEIICNCYTHSIGVALLLHGTFAKYNSYKKLRVKAGPGALMRLWRPQQQFTITQNVSSNGFKFKQ